MATSKVNVMRGLNKEMLEELIEKVVKAQTVSLGTVETLAYGESAYVTIGGNDTNAILNFGIPGGLMPNHEVDGYNIRFRQTENTWGDWIDLEPSHDPTIIEFRDQANDAAISAANFASSALSSANDAHDYANDAYSYWLDANDAAVNASLYMGNASVSANSAWGYAMNAAGYMDSSESWANSAGNSASAASSYASIAANAAATFNLATAQISGFSPTSGTVANGDTILTAIDKMVYKENQLWNLAWTQPFLWTNPSNQANSPDYPLIRPGNMSTSDFYVTGTPASATGIKVYQGTTNKGEVSLSSAGKTTFTWNSANTIVGNADDLFHLQCNGAGLAACTVLWFPKWGNR